jgi:hypothetical protein
MVADLTGNDATIVNFLHAYGIASIPYNLTIPGREGQPAIAIEGPVKSGAPFIKAIGLASK